MTEREAIEKIGIESILHSLAEHTPEPIRQLIGDVQKNPAKAWPLKVAADQVGYAPFHFSRVFKSLSGIGFHEFVDRCRAAIAVHLIANASERLSINEIASTCGFATVGFLREKLAEFLELHDLRPENRIDLSGGGSRPSRGWTNKGEWPDTRSDSNDSGDFDGSIPTGGNEIEVGPSIMGPPSDAIELSQREIEVARLLARGLSNMGIADFVGLAPKTVVGIVTKLKKRFGATDRTSLAIKLRRSGFSFPPDGLKYPAYLAPRELETAELAATFVGDGEVARSLGVAISTVRRTLSTVMDKLGISDRRELGATLDSLKQAGLLYTVAGTYSEGRYETLDTPALSMEELVIVFASDRVDADDIAGLFTLVNRAIEFAGGSPLEILDGGIGRLRERVPA